MSNEGFLNIRTYTSDAMIPLDGSIVIVSEENSGGRSITAIAETDDTGLTRVILLAAPDAENSLTPDSGKPYLSVAIEAEHPGFERIRADNVQIFPGITTTQEFMMHPLSDDPLSREQREVFEITSQNL